MDSNQQINNIREEPKPNAVRRLYNWVLHWAETPYGIPMLCVIAFAESSIFPIPPDVLLIPLVLGAMSKWWRIALWCTISSVLGGAVGYLIGAAAWDSLGLWIINNVLHLNLDLVEGRYDIALPHYLVSFFGDGLGGKYLFQAYDKWNAWIVFAFGLTPLPYKLVTISAGVAKVNFVVFTLASIAARAARFFLVAWILKKWGHVAKAHLDKHFNLAVILFTVLLFGSFAAVKLLLNH